MPDYAPIINDYKLAFARRRLLQSLLGGARFLTTFNVPWAVRIIQLLVLLCPALAGAVLHIVSVDLITPYVLGGTLVVVSGILAVLSAWTHHKEGDMYSGGGKKGQMEAEEDEDYDFDSCFSYDTFRFICPRKHPMLVILGLITSFCLGAGAGYALNPKLVSAVFPSTYIPLLVFAWFAVCISYFSVAGRPAADPAQYRLAELAIEQSAHVPAVFLSLLFLGIYLNSILTSSAIVNQALLIVTTVLPWLRFLGSIPQIDTLLSWAIEHANVYFFGGSRSANDVRMFTMLLLSCGGSGLVYVVNFTVNYGPATMGSAVFLGILLAYNPFWGLGWLSGLRKLRMRGKTNAVVPLNLNTNARRAPASSASCPGPGTAAALALPSTTTSTPSGHIQVHDNPLPPLRTSPILKPPSAEPDWGMPPNMATSSTAWNNGTNGTSPSLDDSMDMDDLLNSVSDGGRVNRINVNVSAHVPPKPQMQNRGRIHTTGAANVVHKTSKSKAKTKKPTSGMSMLRRSVPLLTGVSIGVVLGGVAVVLTLGLIPTSTYAAITDILYIVLLILWGLMLVVSQWHRPYICRLMRNPLFRVSNGSSRAALHALPTVLRRCGMLLLAVGSIIVIVFDQSWYSTSASSAPMYYLVTASLMLRAVRHVAQSPVRASSELVFSFYLSQILLPLIPSSTYLYLYAMINQMPWRLLLASFVGDRLMDVLAKLEFAVSLLITSVTEKKAQFRYRIATAVIVTALFPLTVLLPVLISAVLSAPLLPLMGLPIFLVGFPRPLRMWPNASALLSSGSDSAYYKHMEASLQSSLGSPIASGEMGEVEEGSMYLVRHEKQSAWIQILEKGARHVWISLRGLELNETSCHHTEGLGLDSLFSQAKMDTSEAYQGDAINPYAMHVLNPLCAVKTEGYSDSVVSMVGVLDSHDCRTELPALFFKALLWCLVEKLGHRGFALRHTSPSSATTTSLSPKLPNNWRLPDPPSMNMGMGMGSVSVSAKGKSKSPLPAQVRNDAVRAFPVAWYAYILGDGEAEKADSGGYRSQLMTKLYALMEADYDPLIELSLMCYAIVELLGSATDLDGLGTGTEQIVKIFRGKIPASMESQWLSDTPDLHSIVLKAYQYAVKAQIDSLTLGPAESFSELHELFHEYAEDWYMGTSEDADWEGSMAISKPNLFELFKDGTNASMGMNEYKARIVTKQPVTLQIGRLNSETVRGFWSALHLELLYFANDDDERYSIQAHPSLLRNMCVQSASPPLGYPCHLGFVMIPLPPI